MSLDVTGGETFDADTTTYADGVNLDDTLNLSGTLNLTAEADGGTAAGTGTGTGTADATPEAQATAAGTGAGRARLELPYIGAGETVDVAAGERRGESPINLAGTLNLDGTVDVVATGPDLRYFATASGALAGQGTGTGSATTDALAKATAAGLGEGIGTADGFVIRPLRRSTTATIDNTRRTEYDTQGVGDVDD